MKTISFAAMALAIGLAAPALSQTGGTGSGSTGSSGMSGSGGGGNATGTPSTPSRGGTMAPTPGTNAQTAPGGMSSNPNMSGSASSMPGAAMAMPTTAAEFRQQVMFSDAFEIQSSQLAAERSQNTAVKRFARNMVSDHGKTTAMLMRMPGGQMSEGQMQGQRNGNAMTTGSTRASMPDMPVDARRNAMLEQLRAADGQAFDMLYVQMQVAAHQEAVNMFTAFSQNGDDQSMRRFATQNLPTLRSHLRSAQRLEARMNREPNRGARS